MEIIGNKDPVKDIRMEDASIDKSADKNYLINALLTGLLKVSITFWVNDIGYPGLFCKVGNEVICPIRCKTGPFCTHSIE